MPLTVILEPAEPEVAESGLREAVTDTVKSASTVTVPTVTRILCAPAVAPEGMVMELAKPPLVLVLTSPPVGVSVCESNIKIIG